MAILLPALSKATEQARSAVCKSNLKQWGIAGVLYSHNYEGKMIYHLTDTSSWGAWYQNKSFMEMLGGTYRTSSPQGGSLRGMVCPTFDRYVVAHFSSQWGYFGQWSGYHLNAGVTREGGEIWEPYDPSKAASWAQITRGDRSPWMIEGSGLSQANPYGGYPGCPPDIPSEQLAYYYEGNGSSYFDIRYRHDGSANILMVGQHVVSVRGEYTDEEEPQAPDDVTVHTELNLTENGDPWEWHWKFDPSNP